MTSPGVAWLDQCIPSVVISVTALPASDPLSSPTSMQCVASEHAIEPPAVNCATTEGVCCSVQFTPASWVTATRLSFAASKTGAKHVVEVGHESWRMIEMFFGEDSSLQ